MGEVPCSDLIGGEEETSLSSSTNLNAGTLEFNVLKT